MGAQASNDWSSAILLLQVIQVDNTAEADGSEKKGRPTVPARVTKRKKRI